jgi:hypothetical protein
MVDGRSLAMNDLAQFRSHAEAARTLTGDRFGPVVLIRPPAGSRGPVSISLD